MNLHRTTGKPDWISVKPADRNMWQNLAVASNGVITPGNFVTSTGLVLVLIGLMQLLSGNLLSGAVLLTAGRICDVIDGILADLTGTKSPLGESTDAVVDKIGTFLTLLVLFYTAAAPRWAVIVIILAQIFASAVVLNKRSRNIRIQPTRIAKLGMATAWIALIGFVLVSGLDFKNLELWNMLLGSLTVLSFMLTVISVVGYSKQQA